MDIQNILLLCTAVLNFGAGIAVFIRNIKDKINIHYFIFSVFIALWCLSLVVQRYFLADELSDLGARSSYITGLLMAYFFYLFTVHFPFRIKDHRNVLGIVIIVACLYFIAVLLFSDYFISGVSLVNGVVISLHDNVNHLVYSIILGATIIAGLYNLFVKFKISDGIYRRQMNLLLIVSVASGLFGYFFDVILIFYYNFSFNWLGPLFLTLMAYSIAKMVTIDQK